MDIAVLQKVLTFQLPFLIPNGDISRRGQMHSPFDRIITASLSLHLPPVPVKSRWEAVYTREHRLLGRDGTFGCNTNSVLRSSFSTCSSLDIFF